MAPFCRVDIPIELAEAPESSEPAILTAIQDQLWLKLAPQLMPKEFLVIDQRSLRPTRSRWRAFEVDWRNIPITLKNSLAAVARMIREQIRSELSLTASAGVAPNKFLAKIASDWKKPDGLFVIQPEEVDSFLLPLPVGRLPGVGKVTEEKLKHLQVQTTAD